MLRGQSGETCVFEQGCRGGQWSALYAEGVMTELLQEWQCQKSGLWGMLRGCRLSLACRLPLRANVP